MKVTDNARPASAGTCNFRVRHSHMATAKKTTIKTAAKKVARTLSTEAPAKKAVATKPVKAAKPVDAGKPIKTTFNKSSLIAYLAASASVEPKVAKAVLGALESAMLASVHKKGLGSFTLPGLLKVNVINVPAKKKRTGIDPFTKVERVFAAKPATVKIKTRALKKLKDAAI